MTEKVPEPASGYLRLPISEEERQADIPEADVGISEKTVSENKLIIQQ
jgi:hypothetical protein